MRADPTSSSPEKAPGLERPWWLRLLGCLGASAGCSVLLFLGAALVTVLPVPVPQVEFDAAAWKAADPEAPGRSRTRQTMTDDLVEHRLEPGMSADELIELLGPPTYERQIDGREVFEYLLGPARIVMPFLEAEFLRVELREDGTVSGYELVEMD